MCWVAVDRGMRLADKRSLPVDITRWRKVRDEIYEDIMAHGWNEEVPYSSSIIANRFP